VEFVAGMPFEEALQKLGERSPIGSILRSEAWSEIPVGLRDRAFFSATIENVRWLQARERFILSFLKNETFLNENGQRVFKAGGRAKFIEEAQRDAIRSGMGPLDPNLKGTIRDIRSETRLGLIFDTNLHAAQDYGYWKQGQDPDVLDAFPSQRFIRVAAVSKPRPRHQANRNEVRRKDDLRFWLAMNDPAIGGFGVPWGPWGFNSGMDVEDVGRDESDALGLTTPDEKVVTDQKPESRDQSPEAGSGIRRADIDFNAHMEASTRGLKPPMINLLKAAFEDQVTFEGDRVMWTDISLGPTGGL
jgi:hypothetical protein